MMGGNQEAHERTEMKNSEKSFWVRRGANRREMQENTREACCRAWGRCRGGVDTDTTAGGEREVGRD